MICMDIYIWIDDGLMIKGSMELFAYLPDEQIQHGQSFLLSTIMDIILTLLWRVEVKCVLLFTSAAFLGGYARLSKVNLILWSSKWIYDEHDNNVKKHFNEWSKAVVCSRQTFMKCLCL